MHVFSVCGECGVCVTWVCLENWIASIQSSSEHSWIYPMSTKSPSICLYVHLLATSYEVSDYHQMWFLVGMWRWMVWATERCPPISVQLCPLPQLPHAPTSHWSQCELHIVHMCACVCVWMCACVCMYACVWVYVCNCVLVVHAQGGRLALWQCYNALSYYDILIKMDHVYINGVH